MRVNLLPVEYRPQPLFDSKRIFIVALASFLVVCSLGGAFFLFLQAQYARDTLAAVTQQREALETERQKVEAVEKRVTDLQKRLDDVANIKKSYPNYVTYLNTFGNALGAEVWLRNTSFSAGQVSLEGSSLSFAIIGDLLKNLSQENFPAVRLNRIAEQKKEQLTYYDFAVSIRIKEGGAAYAQ